MMTHHALLLFLRTHSYTETTPVAQSGEFNVQGDTITYWPVNQGTVFRAHFLGEELERVEQREKEYWIPVEALPELWSNEIETEHGLLHPEEYIVHPYHGVGIFKQIQTRTGGEGKPRQFVTLLYAGNDLLLFPWERRSELMPYIGSRHPRLNRLYSKSWQRIKERVQKDLVKVARELLRIYAARQLTQRSPYPSALEWETVLAQESGFELTGDQERAVRDIDADLSGTVPMDRLVCGDVGYGKTEVALRAAARVLAAGRQVALIAPTTVLAEQHYTLARDRFASLPVAVEHLSRLTASRDREIVTALGEGKVECVIGTHRLLGKDIRFKDLGLLILDEEQKFGVAQKEYLKQVRPSVDVLSLSATPIPRTLSMSLSGLRGLSILRTAPQGRRPVNTIIGPYTDRKLREALDTELSRGGQVYVVHNRVQSLTSVRERVCEQLRQAGYLTHPYESKQEEISASGVRVAMAHGQMGEMELARTMSDFLAGRIEVLVASSIVEHGLDSPHANTLVVLHSEWFGLSDLYQLRGRVGRRTLQAHAYFFVGGIERTSYEQAAEEFQTTETARRRLAALQEADTLGSGWSIAMRDLEIRGGGNILGHEQHGNMEAIGLLLYAQLLQEEIGRQAKRLGIPIFQKRAIME